MLACTGEQPSSSAAKVMAEEARKKVVDLSYLPPPKNDAERESQLNKVVALVAPKLEPTEYRFSGDVDKHSSQSHMLVLRYGHCYRIIGVGSEGIEDLDLALLDSQDVERSRDLSSDRFPQIGVDPELCPNNSSGFRLEVRAYAGSGRYSVAVMQTPAQI